MLQTLISYIPDLIGLAGVIVILIAYYLLNMGKLSAFSLKYQWLNLLGAIGIIFSLLFSFNISSFVMEVAWVFVSLLGIYRTTRAQHAKHDKESDVSA